MQPTRTSVRAPSQPGFASRTALIERRQADRQAATGSILISPGNEGALLDWSAGGFSAESNLAVRVGGTYRLRRRRGETPQSLTGVVRWSRPGRARVVGVDESRVYLTDETGEGIVADSSTGKVLATFEAAFVVAARS